MASGRLRWHSDQRDPLRLAAKALRRAEAEYHKAMQYLLSAEVSRFRGAMVGVTKNGIRFFEVISEETHHAADCLEEYLTAERYGAESQEKINPPLYPGGPPEG